MCTQTMMFISDPNKNELSLLLLLLHEYFISLRSTLALGMCTSRKTSSSAAARQLVRRPSLTCARCATAFAFPLENTSSSPRPSNRTRTQTFIYGYSLRKLPISSKFANKTKTTAILTFITEGDLWLLSEKLTIRWSATLSR